VVDSTLWTISNRAVQANDLASLATIGSVALR
jgi:hypothetical protein